MGLVDQHRKRLPYGPSTFGRAILVECPRCSRCAHVSFEKWSVGQLRCTACGYVAEKDRGSDWSNWSYTRGVDPFFDLPLWLRERVPDGYLWAYNWQQLDDLEFFLLGEWKGRRTNLKWESYSPNWSYRPRYPQWMFLKRNQGRLLRAVERIKRRRLK